MDELITLEEEREDEIFGTLFVIMMIVSMLALSGALLLSCLDTVGVL